MARSKQSLLLLASCIAVVQPIGMSTANAHGSADVANRPPVLRATGPGSNSASEAMRFPTLQPVAISGNFEFEGDNNSPVLSADAHLVVFESDSDALIGDNPNGVINLMMFDVYDQQVARISANQVHPNGDSKAASVSSNGDLIAFESKATNLVAGDTNESQDIFVYDRRSGSIALVSLSVNGMGANGASHSAQVSADGMYVAFVSEANNLVPDDNDISEDIFLHSFNSKKTELIDVTGALEPEPGRQISNGEPGLSGDGRFVVFSSYAQLKSGETRRGIANIFVFDRMTGTSKLVSKGMDGIPANRASGSPTISADGRWIAFLSSASNLIEGDDNGRKDVFLYDREQDQIHLVSQSLSGSGSTAGESLNPRVSADGQQVVFQSNVSPSSAADQAYDLFIYDIPSGNIRRVLNFLPAVDRNEPSVSDSGHYLTYSSLEAGSGLRSTRQYSSIYLVKLRD